MSRLSAHRLGGTLASASGAAAAVLKSCAAAQDAPIHETETGLSVILWGGQIRLERSGRLDLHAPEARLIGVMQDLVTGIMADAGLVVAWERVDAGALAPGLAVMRVEDVAPVGASYLRVRLSGPDAGRFAQGGLHFRLLLPPPGRAAIWPRMGASGRTEWPEGADALHRPVYTVAGQGGDWLEFDIFRHAGSPTCDWAASGAVGQQVAIMGPGGGGCPLAPALLFFGDQTALPAIRRMLALAPVVAPECRMVEAHVQADPADLGGDTRLRSTDDLLGALQRATIPEGAHVWFAGRAGDARAARQHLTERGLSRRDFTAAAYWD